MKRYYITTAIDYANGAPHLGHAYEKVLADAIIRTHRMMGEETFFLTGLDEHGQKVQQTAEKQGLSPQALCDGVAERFKSLCAQLGVKYDRYVRTTEAGHKAIVQALLQKLFNEGHIYKASYTGFYSARAEQFLQEKDRNEDGTWPDIYGEVHEVVEENYFFRLSQHQDWLREYIEAHEEIIFPKFRRAQILEFLKEPLNDLCISRPIERLSWGIPLPFDAGFVTYVWFDALLNYVTAAGYGTPEFEKNWPADAHVIGKDILVPPHAVYWPIMLKVCEIGLPKSFIVHGWWLASGEKMSKSVGNVVDPLSLIEAYGADAFRFFLLREMNVGQDGDFSLERFEIRYKSDLGNDLGNLVSRLLNMVSRYAEGKIPAASSLEEPEETLKALAEKVGREVPELYLGYQFHTGLESTWELVRGINRYAELRAPWKLAKLVEAGDKVRLETTLAVMAEALRIVSVLIAPVMPTIATEVRRLIGLGVVKSFEEAKAWGSDLTGNILGAEGAILFPRKE